MPFTTDQLLLIQLLASFGMLVLIWLIQLLHYPSFLFVETSRFQDFESFHQKTISYLVVPLMLSELLLGLYFAFEFTNPWTLSNLLLVLVLWAYTFAVSARIHQKLSSGYDTKLILQLISTNWPRTILWTSKFALLLFWPQL